MMVEKIETILILLEQESSEDVFSTEVKKDKFKIESQYEFVSK